MKKFIIISAILLVIGGTAFGYSLVRFLNVTQPAVEPTEAAATADQATQAATQAPTLKQTDTGMTDGGLFADHYADAKTYVSKLTKEQMVGQILVGVCADPETAADEINKYNLGGMMFVSSNFEGMTEEQIFAAIGKAGTGVTIAPIMAAEEEGGDVSTFSSVGGDSYYDDEDYDDDEDEDYDEDYDDEDEEEEEEEVSTRSSRSADLPSFDSPRNIYEADGISALQANEDKKSAFLKKMGINLNLAPVVDMPDSYDQIMYTRSLSSDPKVVSTYAEYCAKFNQAKGVSVGLKHFPGYGTIPDEAAYEDVVTDTRDADTIRQNDYTPFKAGSAAGAHFVVMSNVVVKSMDPSHPASLSPTMHRELRDSVGFKGLIITDVIDDNDYSAYADGHDPAVQAVLAGNDMILVQDYGKAYNAILAGIEDGTIDQQIIEDCCTRVIAYKLTAGIIK